LEKRDQYQQEVFRQKEQAIRESYSELSDLFAYAQRDEANGQLNGVIVMMNIEWHANSLYQSKLIMIGAYGVIMTTYLQGDYGWVTVAHDLELYNDGQNYYLIGFNPVLISPEWAEIYYAPDSFSIVSENGSGFTISMTCDTQPICSPVYVHDGALMAIYD
jgi:hypothetical protein